MTTYDLETFHLLKNLLQDQGYYDSHVLAPDSLKLVKLGG